MNPFVNWRKAARLVDSNTDDLGIVPGFGPTPATLASAEIQRIDRELATLAAQPRTDITLAAMDHWLDRRYKLRPSVPVVPGGAR